MTNRHFVYDNNGGVLDCRCGFRRDHRADEIYWVRAQLDVLFKTHQPGPSGVCEGTFWEDGDVVRCGANWNDDDGHHHLTVEVTRMLSL